jgi:hypothetical protein
MKKNTLTLRLSSLSKTWILDLDGTLVKHNGYKEGEDTFLPGALSFLKSIPESDFIIILTSRKNEISESTKNFLENQKVRYNTIIFEVPVGERILFNDSKPSGLNTAHTVSLERDHGLENIKISIDQNL